MCCMVLKELSWSGPDILLKVASQRDGAIMRELRGHFPKFVQNEHTTFETDANIPLHAEKNTGLDRLRATTI